MSFLGGTKLVVVRNLHDAIPKDEDAQSLIDYCKNPIVDACMVITADKADRKYKLFKALTNAEGAVICDAPKENVLATWVRDRAKSEGYTMTINAARALANRVGPRPGILAQELDKTLIYSGKKKEVSEKERGWTIDMPRSKSLKKTCNIN